MRPVRGLLVAVEHCDPAHAEGQAGGDDASLLGHFSRALPTHLSRSSEPTTFPDEAYHRSVALISRDDVAHVARLARLDVSEEELDRFAEQLGAVLEHAADVAALDTAGVPPTAHPFPLVNVLRDDVVGPSLDRDEVLAAAPAAEDGRFRVPRILGEAP